MSDRPWLEEGDPSLRVERALLKRLNAEQPPAGLADQRWAVLAAQIAAPPTSPIDLPHAAAHAAKASSVALIAKVVVGVALTGAAVFTGRALMKPGSTSSISHSPAPVSTPAEAPRASEETAGEAVAGKTTDEGSPVKIQSPANASRPTSSATTLAEEGRLLAKAHQLVQSDPQQALEVLRQSESRYPHSVLSQEREVLTIEALGASGAASAAKQRAERFLKRYPNSAYTSRLRRFVE